MFTGPCSEFKCPTVAEVCVVNDNGEAECECPSEDELDDEVCGYVVWPVGGTKPKTWDSESHLRHYACKKDAVDFEVMHEGACGGMYCCYLTIQENVSSGLCKQK